MTCFLPDVGEKHTAVLENTKRYGLKISFPLFHWKPLLSMLLFCLNQFKTGAS